MARNPARRPAPPAREGAEEEGPPAPPPRQRGRAPARDEAAAPRDAPLLPPVERAEAPRPRSRITDMAAAAAAMAAEEEEDCLRCCLRKSGPVPPPSHIWEGGRESCRRPSGVRRAGNEGGKWALRVCFSSMGLYTLAYVCVRSFFRWME